jgi:glycosyltransferase involved in cell wall biosynthesis
MMPIEKKFFFIIAWLVILRPKYGFELVSYNHPITKSGRSSTSFLDRWLSRLFYSWYDKVIFYTQASMQWAVAESLIPNSKAFFANNTLDTSSIWNHYKFHINKSRDKSILFIGRLIESKRIDELLRYFNELSKLRPSCELMIIGDGPERDAVRSAQSQVGHIKWFGAISDEKKICKLMESAHVVFVPGASGLSIVHAFCYGKPYVTIRRGSKHGPELAYIQDGQNGLLLDSTFDNNVRNILGLLESPAKYESMCRKAYETAESLSIDQWCAQIRDSLVSER